MNIARQLNPGMNRRAVMRYLGLPKTSRRDEAQPVVKSLLVAARRNNDDDTAAVLSQIKAFVNRLPGKCEHLDCDMVQKSRRCFVHAAPSRARKRLSAIVATLILVICASCKTETPKRVAIPFPLADIPQRAVARPVVSNQLAVVPSPLKPITLAWDWNTPEWFARSTDVYVYSSQNLKTWTIKTNSICLATRTNCPTQFVFANDRPMEFYQVLVTNVSMRKGWFVTLPNTK